MTNFSYIWIFTLFLLQVITLGVTIGKLGEEKKGKYSLGDVFFTILICTLTGLSIYWLPKE